MWSTSTACRSFATSAGWLLLIAVLGAQTPGPDRSWRLQETPAELRPAVSRAELIVLSMQSELLRELTSALARGGPELAVQSCHVDVVGIIQRIGQQEGVAAGRTSDRLRNSANAPRRWAAPLVMEYAGRPARTMDGFVVDLGSRIGVLKPIAHQPMCASCHGPADRMDASVRAVIAGRYPRDQATGFVDGETRGWFWVEVPKGLR